MSTTKNKNNKNEDSEKVTLTLLERFMLSTVLLKESDIKSIMLIRDIKNKAEVKQEEWKKYGIEILPNGGINWNEAGKKAVFEIEFTTLEKLEIKLGIQKLDNDKKLTEDHISLYDKFVK